MKNCSMLLWKLSKYSLHDLSRTWMMNYESPLTLSQLMIGRRLLSKAGKTPSEAPQTRSELPRRLKYLTTVLSQFWRGWQKEYLTELRVHHNCQLKNRQPTINVGDVVYIHKNRTPRLFWNMGVVKSLITG